MTSIQRDVNVTTLAKRTGKSSAYIRNVFGQDGIKDDNGQIWFSNEIADDIALNLADRAHEQRQFSVGRKQFARALGVHEKTISERFGHMGCSINGELRFERAFVDEVLRELGDLSAYTVSTACAAQIIDCSIELARSLLRGKGRKKGRQLFFTEGDVETAAQRQKDLQCVGVDYIAHYFELSGPQVLYVAYASVKKPGVTHMSGELQGHLPTDAELPAANSNYEWPAGVVIPWFKTLLADPSQFLTAKSVARFWELEERNFLTEAKWRNYEMWVTNARSVAKKAEIAADLQFSAKALRRHLV